MYQLSCPSPPTSGTCAEGWVVTEQYVSLTQAEFYDLSTALVSFFAVVIIMKVILRFITRESQS